ncbi:MAG: EamA family transporter [Myxococcota bacterium]
MQPELWIVLAIGAALAQTTRNAFAQNLSSQISPALNSWSRFAFCLPFAAATCVAVSIHSGLPKLPAAFFACCLVTALTQLLGNVALIAAFRAGSFGESIVFHKLEVVLTALAGAMLFGEFPSALGWVGIAVCALGVIAINLGREGGVRDWTRAFRMGPAGGYALLCAALLVIASFALKAGNGIVASSNPEIADGAFAAPVQTLFHTTWMEVVLLSLWIGKKEPASFRAVGQHWRRMLMIGSTGFIASLGWFWAFSLTLVAYVKAVGQIEALIAVALGIRLLGERGLMRQLPGILLVVLGISFVLLS